MVVKKKVKLTLVGLDGNAFFLMAMFQRAAREQGWLQAEINEVLEECKSGDYDHLLYALIQHCEDDEEVDEDEEEDD